MPVVINEKGGTRATRPQAKDDKSPLRRLPLAQTLAVVILSVLLAGYMAYRYFAPPLPAEAANAGLTDNDAARAAQPQTELSTGPPPFVGMMNSQARERAAMPSGSANPGSPPPAVGGSTASVGETDSGPGAGLTDNDAERQRQGRDEN